MPLDERAKQEILDNISKYGSTDKETAKYVPTIARNAEALLRRSSGLPTFNAYTAKKFNLIFQMPEPFASLDDFHPAEIRCCLCNRIMRYPCWYFVQKYHKNHIHYFVCSSLPDGIRDDKVSTRCTRK